jgi:hypothetical protein
MLLTPFKEKQFVSCFSCWWKMEHLWFLFRFHPFNLEPRFSAWLNESLSLTQYNMIQFALSCGVFLILVERNFIMINTNHIHYPVIQIHLYHILKVLWFWYPRYIYQWHK